MKLSPGLTILDLTCCVEQDFI